MAIIGGIYQHNSPFQCVVSLFNITKTLAVMLSIVITHNGYSLISPSNDHYFTLCSTGYLSEFVQFEYNRCHHMITLIYNSSSINC